MTEKTVLSFLRSFWYAKSFGIPGAYGTQLIEQNVVEQAKREDPPGDIRLLHTDSFVPSSPKASRNAMFPGLLSAANEFRGRELIDFYLFACRGLPLDSRWCSDTPIQPRVPRTDGCLKKRMIRLIESSVRRVRSGLDTDLSARTAD